MATSFKLEHSFPNISIEKFEKYLNDPELNEQLKAGLKFKKRELVEKIVHENKKIEWHFLVSKVSDVPSAIKKVFKDSDFSWREVSIFDPAKHEIVWTIEPLSKNLKFSGHGFWRLKKGKKGTQRIIEGTISVEIPLIGKIAEKFIVAEMVKSYECEPKIQEKFYREKE